jgi:hypothetical protein
MVTELHMLQRVAKSLGIKATGTRADLLRRLTRELDMSESELLARIHETTKEKRRRNHRDHRDHRGYRDHRRYSTVVAEPTENELIFSYCGAQCFADKDGNVPICPPCDDEKCYCYPECPAIRDAYLAGYDRERMQAYAEALDCPGWPKTMRKIKQNKGPVGPIGEDRVSIFDVDDIVVTFIEQNGNTYPIFGMVTDIKVSGADGGWLEIKALAHDDFEITDVVSGAKDLGIEFTADDLFSIESNFAIIPKAKFADARPLIKTNLEGYWKTNNVYFDFFDETKLYLRHYSIRDIKKIMKRVDV